MTVGAQGFAEGREGNLLPVHGFALAGGKSSRMGRDKVLLAFRGRPMVEIAVEKLRSFCAAVSISGNRPELVAFAPVVEEKRLEIGPAAGLEAGLQAASEAWCLFLPADVPLLPADLLRRWTEAVLGRTEAGVRLSFLRAGGQRHPAICLLHRECLETVSFAVQEGTYKLGRIFELAASRLSPQAVWAADAESFCGEGEAGRLEYLFSNVNTPEELAAAAVWAEATNEVSLTPLPMDETR